MFFQCYIVIIFVCIITGPHSSIFCRKILLTSFGDPRRQISFLSWRFFYAPTNFFAFSFPRPVQFKFAGRFRLQADLWSSSTITEEFIHELSAIISHVRSVVTRAGVRVGLLPRARQLAAAVLAAYLHTPCWSRLHVRSTTVARVAGAQKRVWNSRQRPV